MLSRESETTAALFLDAAKTKTTLPRTGDVDAGKAKRPSPLTLRLSDAELKAVRAVAEQQGVNVSAYVRSQLFGKSGQRKNMPSTDRAALGRALALLGQSEIADSLKTLAHEARCGSLLLDEEALVKIDTACVHVVAMRQALVAALGLRKGVGR